MPIAVELLVKLAAYFKTHHMPDHVDELRNFWRAQHGQALRWRKRKRDALAKIWDEEFVERWLMLARMPGHEGPLDVREHGASCSKCSRYSGSVYTQAVFPGGSVMRCRCGEEWIVYLD